MPAYVVVDASVAGAWLFPESFSANAQPVLAAIEAHRIVALVPDRFAEELLRVCQKKTLPLPNGSGVAQEDAWGRFVNVITSPIELVSSLVLHERAWELAFAVQITTHDALYLALADRWNAELWTLDDLLAARGAAVYAAVRNLRTTAFPH